MTAFQHQSGIPVLRDEPSAEDPLPRYHPVQEEFATFLCFYCDTGRVDCRNLFFIR